MKLNNYIIGALLFWITSPIANGQNGGEKSYVFPIKPGTKNYLAGTMGELRATHFHAGLDIKTDGVVGLPVYAIDDGYVSRIKVSHGGYGNALYVLHPNGYTSVYAHLSKYESKVAEYIKNAQYKNESFVIELFPEPGQFSFKKGDIIASSGNSGSSSGPHLHFEIRNHQQHVLNPLNFSFKEVTDNIAPSINRIALVPLNSDARVNKAFDRVEFTPTRNGNKYEISRQIFASGEIGIEVLAYDRQDGSNNRNGVQLIELMVDGNKIFEQDISKFSFGESRNVLALTNFKVMRTKRSRFNKLYVDDGNELSFYKNLKNKGKINLKEKSYAIEVRLTDSYGNKSQLNFQIIGEPLPVGNKVTTKYGHGRTGYEIKGSTLKFTAKLKETTAPFAAVYANRMKHEITPAYYQNNEAVYLWNLPYAQPDSIDICGEKLYFNFKAMIPANSSFQFYHKNIDLNFPRKSLFDTLYLNTDYRVNSDSTIEYFISGPVNTPMRKYITMTFKPKLTYAEKEKYRAYTVSRNNNYSYEGGSWKGNNFVLRTRELGTYALIKDDVAPTIDVVSANSKNLRFRINDALSGIKSYRLEVNGEWVLLKYDYKRKLVWSEKKDPTKPFKGKVKLVVTDNSGNKKMYTSQL